MASVRIFLEPNPSLVSVLNNDIDYCNKVLQFTHEALHNTTREEKSIITIKISLLLLEQNMFLSEPHEKKSPSTLFSVQTTLSVYFYNSEATSSIMIPFLL
jgi:hypothetical protein